MSLTSKVGRSLKNQLRFKDLNAFTPGGTSNLNARKALYDAESQKPKEQPKSAIDGLLIAVKDNICATSWPTTCGSRMLQDFRSPYSATVVEKLEAAGALIVGKTNLDEFGMGSHSIHSTFGPVYNSKSPMKDPVSAGGSSGGSAVAVATGQCWAALGTDTGGSVRLPAAYNGVLGFKPSYGMISRYGVIAYANSLDTVGILATKSSVVKQVFDEIKGYDERDPTSLSPNTRRQIQRSVSTSARGPRFRIGVPIEYNIQELEPVVRKTWLDTLQSLRARGHSIHTVSLPATKLALSAYYVIAPAEASSNLAKYDGVRYGSSPETTGELEGVLYANTRGAGLGEEVQRRILLGAYTLSASAIDNYFIKAQKVRRLVQQDFENVFAMPHPLLRGASKSPNEGGVDFLLSPTAPSTPPRLKTLESRTPVDNYKDDVLTVPASLAGLPAMSVPVGKMEDSLLSSSDGLSTLIGLQITAQYGDDDLVFTAAEIIAGLE